MRVRDTHESSLARHDASLIQLDRVAHQRDWYRSKHFLRLVSCAQKVYGVSGI